MPRGCGRKINHAPSLSVGRRGEKRDEAECVSENREWGGCGSEDKGRRGGLGRVVSRVRDLLTAVCGAKSLPVRRW